jgi:hypothetical protein
MQHQLPCCERVLEQWPPRISLQPQSPVIGLVV